MDATDSMETNRQHQTPQNDSLESTQDPRWRIPTHSQQHPSDSSYQPAQHSLDQSTSNSTATRDARDPSSSFPSSIDPARDALLIVASKAGQYKVLPASQLSTASTSASASQPPASFSPSSSSISQAQWISKSKATPEMIRTWRAAKRQRDEVKGRSRDLGVGDTDAAAAPAAARKRKRSSARSSESSSDDGIDSPSASPRRPAAKRTISERPAPPGAPMQIYVDVPYKSQEGRHVPYHSETQSTFHGDLPALQGAELDTQPDFGAGRDAGITASSSPASSQVNLGLQASLQTSPAPNQTPFKQVERSSELHLGPMRHLTAEIFKPYLDDDTGVILDSEGRPRHAASTHAVDPHDLIVTPEHSSPVDQFSQSPRSPSPPYEPHEVPRVGSWIVPKPPRRIGPRPPPPRVDDETDPILTQQIDLDDDLTSDDEHEHEHERVETAYTERLPDEMESRAAQDTSMAPPSGSSMIQTPPLPRPAGSLAAADADAMLPVSQPSGYLSHQERPDGIGQDAVREPPRESTPPAGAATTVQPHGDRPLLPSQPIASQPAAAVRPTPTDTQAGPERTPRRPRQQPAEQTPTVSLSQSAPFHRGAGPGATHPTSSLHASDTSSSGLSSSQGWSSLPRREVCDLVHRSTHIPPFLKDELAKYVMRSKRASHSQRSNTTAASGSNGGDGAVLSPSQSQSQSQDDSETQEDGFLCTKKVWCFDLLRGQPDANPTGLRDATFEPPGRSEVVVRFTQSQQSGSTSGARTVILLVDTDEATFDVQEVEENLAAILREDPRFGAAFDAEGKRWPSGPAPRPRPPAPGAPSAVGNAPPSTDEKDEQIATLRSELANARTQLAASTSEVARLSTALSAAQDEHTFLRELYDTASTSSAHYRALSDTQAAQLALLRTQLDEGLALHTRIAAQRRKADAARIRTLQVQLALLQAQEQRTGDAVRQKAALWDAQVLHAAEQQRQSEERARRADERREELRRELGGLDADGRAEGDEADDELAALRAEAAEAGETDETVPAEGDGRTRRSRRGRTAVPAEAAAVPPALQISTDLANQTRLDVEEQLDRFVGGEQAGVEQPGLGGAAEGRETVEMAEQEAGAEGEGSGLHTQA